MTPLPKKKHTPHRQGRRRAGITLATKKIIVCTACGAKKIAHRACEACGK